MPTVEQLKDLAKENDLSGYSDLNKEGLEKLLADNNVEVPEDSDGDDAASATTATAPAGPVAPAPSLADQPGRGRAANVGDSALPGSLAERNARIREGKAK